MKSCLGTVWKDFVLNQSTALDLHIKEICANFKNNSISMKTVCFVT